MFLPKLSLLILVCLLCSCTTGDDKSAKKQQIEKIEPAILVDLVRNGKSAEIQSLLEQGLDPNSIVANGNMTILMWAASSKQLEISKMLVSAGAEINRQDDFGNTALLNAAKGGSPELIKYLLMQRADPNLVSYTQATSPLIVAVGKEDPQLVKQLLSFNVDLDHQEKERGLTALSLATLRSSEEIALMLLRAGASPHIKNKDGLTAADIARSAGKKQLEKMLLGAGHVVAATQLPGGWTAAFPFTDKTRYWPEYAVLSEPRDPEDVRRVLFRSPVSGQSQIFVMRTKVESLTADLQKRLAEFEASPIHTVQELEPLLSKDGVKIPVQLVSVSEGLLSGKASVHMLGSAEISSGYVVVDAGGSPESFDSSLVNQILASLNVTDY